MQKEHDISTSSIFHGVIILQNIFPSTFSTGIEPLSPKMYYSCLMCCKIVYSKAGCQVRSFLRWQLTLHLFLQAAFIKRAVGEIFQLSLSRPATFRTEEIKKRARTNSKEQTSDEF
jgi:hypothetical protein